MKTKQKIILGLSFLAFGLAIMFVSPQKTLAATVIKSQEQIQAGLSTLEFKNRATIEGVFAGQPIKFIDEDPYDTTYNYKPEAGYFCSTGENVSGITITGGAIATIGKVPSSAPAQIDLDFNKNESTGKQGCSGTKPEKLSGGVRTNGVAFSALGWSSGNLTEFSSGDNLVQLSKTARNLYVRDRGGKCFGDKVVTLSNDNLGWIYELSESSTSGKTGNKAGDASKDSLLKEYFTKSGQCYIKSAFQSSVLGPRTASQLPGDPTGAGDASADACESHGGTLNWVFCSLIGYIDDAFTAINNEVENRLTVNANNFQSEEIKKTWSIFRVIATSVLVIIMLVMVISQAIGTSVFEAYTVRKILPRLVVAAILIQLSLSMFLWIIALANNAGNGIFDLIAIPFGGKPQLGLDQLIGRLGESVPGGTIAATLFGAAGILIFNPFLVLLVMFMIFMAVLTAAAVLLFREILILACVILGPLALLAWILPGTNRYWKMWWENFSKALLIFPLIMALIAVGRVFAWVIGGIEGNPGIFDWFGVLIGFFLPYYLLPKTFKWGGSLMSSAGSAINSTMKPLNSFGDRQIRDLGQLYQGRKANDYDPQERAFGAKFGTKNLFGKFGGPAIRPSLSLNGRAWKRLQSGHALPTERSRRLTIGKGNKWAGERNDEAQAYAQAMGESARVNGFKDPVTGKYVKDEDGEIIKGVAAQKLAYNEIAGNEYRTDAQKRAARLAVKLMGQSSSWIEFQKARVLSGPNAGRRITDLPAWRDTLSRDTEEYSRTLGPRPDNAPDVIEGARKEVANRLKINTSQLTAAHDDEVSKEKLRISIGRLKAGDIPRLHFGFFEEVARLGDKGLATSLGEQLKEFHTEGGELGRQATAALLGVEMKKKVNAALRLSTTPGTQSLDDIMHAPSGAGAAAAPAVPPPPPGSPAPIPESGTNIPHQASQQTAPARTQAAPQQPPGAAPATPGGEQFDYERMGRAFREAVQDIPTQSGTVRIVPPSREVNLQPGERATEGGVVLPPGVNAPQSQPSTGQNESGGRSSP